jgi:hypothetical protein
MSDDTGQGSFEEELKVRSLSYTTRPAGGLPGIIVDAYPVIRGPFAGKSIPLGIVLPADYPSTAPNGIHTQKSEEISARVQNPQGSDFGGEWIRWSRVTRNWIPGSRRAVLFLAQADAWLELR